MASDQSALKTWHEDEERWWNAYGEYMTYQWQLTPKMSAALRTELEADYETFLLQPGGRLLDIGCGSGWLSAHFAEQGMQVTGIDVSREQIAAANAMKEARGLEAVDFQCVDFVNWDMEDYRGAFSSVFVSAFLHHLPEPELALTLKRIAGVLKPGGRVFLYEPLQRTGGRSLSVKIVDRFYNMAIQVLLDTLPRRFRWWSERHLAEVERGYTMNSPHEAPVAIESLQQVCGHDFDVVETRGWHLNSLGVGMQSMGLREDVRKKYESIVASCYRLDCFLFRRFGWEAFSLPGRFILCSVKMVRR